MRVVRVRAGVDEGFIRVATPSGFSYAKPNGSKVSAAHKTRIDSLVIPPAWTDVWIAADPRAHIQAVGTDAADRRQYIYHPQWQQRRQRGKFARALLLAETLPRARARVTTALRGELGARETTLAAAFRLLDQVAPRVGSSRYLERHGSRGLSTLRRRDVQIDGDDVSFSFAGKSGQRVNLAVTDSDLARVLDHLSRGRPTAFLLWYWSGRRQRALTASEINAYVKELTGQAFTAKDFRTLRGTIIAAESLASAGEVASGSARKHAHADAAKAAAQALGNTPAVARGSYIDPRVFRNHAKGNLLDLKLTPESAIRHLLSNGKSEGAT